MVLTRDYKDTVKDRVARDPAFREELLKEGIENSHSTMKKKRAALGTNF
jgi:hypothetical protein